MMRYILMLSLFIFSATLSPCLAEGIKEETSFKEVGENQESPLPPYDESHFFDELMNMLITLGFIVALFIALAWIMKKMQVTRVRYGNESSEIKVIDQRSFSPKSTLYLLEVYGKFLLIADSANGISTIAEFPSAESGRGKGSSTPFEKLLEKSS